VRPAVRGEDDALLWPGDYLVVAFPLLAGGGPVVAGERFFFMTSMISGTGWESATRDPMQTKS
jgi:hypothetical protein